MKGNIKSRTFIADTLDDLERKTHEWLSQQKFIEILLTEVDMKAKPKNAKITYVQLR